MQVLRVWRAGIAALVILMDQPVLFAPYGPGREMTHSLRIDLLGFMRFVDIIGNVERFFADHENRLHGWSLRRYEIDNAPGIVERFLPIDAVLASRAPREHRMVHRKPEVLIRFLDPSVYPVQR
jgi:hypothetical protein